MHCNIVLAICTCNVTSYYSIKFQLSSQLVSIAIRWVFIVHMYNIP